jgi:hypothetical protein
VRPIPAAAARAARTQVGGADAPARRADRRRARQVAAAAFCALALGFAAPRAAGQAASPAGDDYAAALEDLDAGRPEAAIRRLDRVVARQPLNLGAWLDLAIAYCMAEEPDAAARIFLQLDARADLPPAIAEVIAYYREGACRPTRRPVLGFVSAGVGYAKNLNLAPISNLIQIPGLGIILELADSSRPRNAPLAQVEGGLLTPLNRDESLTLGAYGQAIAYRDASEFNLVIGQASLNWRPVQPGWRPEAQASYAQLWLGGKAQLGVMQATGALLRPLDDRWQVGGVLAATRLAYNELSTFDARQMELRARLRWQDGARLRLTGDLGWQFDQAVHDRPGDDRQGPVLLLQATWAFAERQALDVTWRQTWLRDSEPYSPPFFGDTRRAPSLANLNASWRYALTRNLIGRVQVLANWSRDSIELFDYNAQSVTFSLDWLLGR